MANDDKAATNVDKAQAEVSAFQKVMSTNRRLAFAIGGVGIILVVAWAAPKIWGVIKVMANTEIAELRGEKVVLRSKLDGLQGVTNALTSELAQKTHERDELRVTTNTLMIQLDQRTRERDATKEQLSQLKNSAFLIRVETFNNHDAAKRMTISELIEKKMQWCSQT